MHGQIVGGKQGRSFEYCILIFFPPDDADRACVGARWTGGWVVLYPPRSRRGPALARPARSSLAYTCSSINPLGYRTTTSWLKKGERKERKKSKKEHYAAASHGDPPAGCQCVQEGSASWWTVGHMVVHACKASEMVGVTLV